MGKWDDQYLAGPRALPVGRRYCAQRAWLCLMAQRSLPRPYDGQRGSWRDWARKWVALGRSYPKEQRPN